MEEGGITYAGMNCRADMSLSSPDPVPAYLQQLKTHQSHLPNEASPLLLRPMAAVRWELLGIILQPGHITHGKGAWIFAEGGRGTSHRVHHRSWYMAANIWMIFVIFMDCPRTLRFVHCGYTSESIGASGFNDEFGVYCRGHWHAEAPKVFIPIQSLCLLEPRWRFLLGPLLHHLVDNLALVVVGVWFGLRHSKIFDGGKSPSRAERWGHRNRRKPIEALSRVLKHSI